MVAERVNSSQKLLDVGEKGLYSSYTLPACTPDLAYQDIAVSEMHSLSLIHI